MKNVLLLFTLTLPLAGEERPDQNHPPAMIEGEREGVFHMGQAPINGILTLNANNGFFDKGRIRATGKKTADPHEKDLISASFEELQFLPGKSDATARWYLWSENAGKIKVTIQFGKDLVEGGIWSIRNGPYRNRCFVNAPSHRQELTLSVIAGKQTFELTGSGGSVQSIILSGAPIKTTSLLRARWRPSAIHSRFAATGCPEPVMWIFESRSASNCSSYSPLTTNFGYFGATFGNDRRSAGGLNFSMWAVSHKAGKDNLPPLSQMPHLLAVGHPEAEFSGFGHEGSGVKVRNWSPLAHRPASVIQALRVEKNGPYHTYHGYVWDERAEQWKLYTVGNKFPRKNAKPVLRASAFCEVPGPPQVERTGDQMRILERRGWFFDAAGKMFPVDQMSTKSQLKNHHISLSDDHWFQVMTGGLDFRKNPGKITSGKKHPLPKYLQPQQLKQLTKLPVVIGPHLVDQISTSSARVTYDLKETGKEASALLCYGEIDAITFVPRKMHGTEKGRTSEALFSHQRVWNKVEEIESLSDGKQAITLKNLKPGTNYFFRLLVKNEKGKCWAFQSGSFRTTE